METITVRQASEITGIKPDVFRRLIRKGLGPTHFRIADKTILLQEQDVRDWIKSKKRPSK